MRPNAQTTRRRSHGFTITELIVVVSITIVIIGILFPVISALTTSNRVEAGLNTVGMASDVARQWVDPLKWENDGGLVAPLHEQYNGTAALFCPTGEVRIVYNIPSGRNGSGNYLEDFLSIPSPLASNAYLDNPNIDYIRLPDGLGVVGILRTGSNAGDVRFIAPPFAIAYSENGGLNFGNGSGLIYYDSDGNGEFGTSNAQKRPNNYDPRDWNGDRDEPTDFTSQQKLTLPFDAIECVGGVVVFDFDDFAAGFPNSTLFSGGYVDLTNNANGGAWLQENGRALFFSPQSGIALRDEDGAQ